jgi:8-oxo-dGTP diphosphatase
MIECIFEDGGKGKLRHVTVGVIAVNKNNQVLLVRRAEHLIGGGKYSIPGGFLDRDENTKKASLRELEEETGLKGKIVSLFYINDNPRRPKEDRQNVDFIYLAEIESGNEKLNKEVSEIKWFEEDNLPQDEEFAFDHREIIKFFFEHQKSPLHLPLTPEEKV